MKVKIDHHHQKDKNGDKDKYENDHQILSEIHLIILN